MGSPLLAANPFTTCDTIEVHLLIHVLMNCGFRQMYTLSLQKDLHEAVTDIATVIMV